MNNKIYVEMSDKEYLMYREMKPLIQYSPAELASALLSSIKANGGLYAQNMNVISHNEVTTARISEGKFIINIEVERQG